MKKALIVGIIAGGLWGNIAAPLVKPVVAEPNTQPTVQPNIQPSIKPAVQPTTPIIPTTAKLEVLDLGAEPRRELKFSPRANSKQSITMTMDMSMAMTMGETPLPKTAIPKMVIKVDAIVKAIDAAGNIQCSFVYRDIQAIATPETSPEMLAAMNKSVKSMVGVQLDLVMSNNGQVVTKKLILPKTVDPMVKKMLEQFDKSIEQLSNQLPPGKLGLGAKWKMNNTIKTSGLELVQSSTAEIVEINDTGITIKTHIIQSAPTQDLVLPGGLAPGVKSKLMSLTSTGDGTYVMKFDSLLPITGKISTTSDSKISIQMAADQPPTNMSTQMSIDLNISSK
jgi:hypothetical protein